VPLQWGGGDQTSEHLIYDGEILEILSKTMKHQIKSSGGNWPTTKRDWVEKHLHAFTRLIKSVDFYKLQQNIQWLLLVNSGYI
jgi:PhoPQ-activated pathogenicity-related protein